MAMGIEDTMFVGRIGAEAIGAISVGTTIFYTISILGGGLTLGLDTLVSQASGAGDLVDRRRSLVNGLWLTLALIPIVMLAVHGMLSVLATFGVSAAGSCSKWSPTCERSTGARRRCCCSSACAAICSRSAARVP